MLEFDRVSIRFGAKQVLGGASMRAKGGQITALLGKNGSGKSTLLSAVSGACRYTGTIRLDGVDLKELSPRQRAMRIAVMPQVLPLPNVTVLELTAFGRAPYLGMGGRLSPEDRAAVKMAMEEAGVSGLAQRRVCSLSGGERQRAFFAMLLAQNASVILMDEPTANLDTEYRAQLYRDLRKMRDAGLTLIIVLHHLSEVVELANTICVLQKGQIVFSGTPDEFIESAVPEEVFHVRPVRAFREDGQKLTVFQSIALDLA
jgi:iron complex transport system ATP-binding protein